MKEGKWIRQKTSTWNISMLLDRVENFTQEFVEYFKNHRWEPTFKDTLTRILVLFVYTVASKERPGVSELISSCLRHLIEDLSSFYDINAIKNAAVALRSHLSLVVIYESSKEWVYALKARLLSDTMKPVRCLLHYLHRVDREDQRSMLIYYTM